MKRAKQPKAIWTSAYPEQAKKLHPERSESGGVKARSGSRKVRDEVYSAINELFASSQPYCAACHLIWPDDQAATTLHFRDDTHHVRGTQGLLYFHPKWFKSVCRRAHRFIHDNPLRAVELGLLSAQFNPKPTP